MPLRHLAQYLAAHSNCSICVSCCFLGRWTSPNINSFDMVVISFKIKLLELSQTLFYGQHHPTNVLLDVSLNDI